MAKEDDDVNLYIQKLVQRANLLRNILQSLPSFDQVMKNVEDGLKRNTGLDALVHQLEPLRKHQEVVKKKLQETMIPQSCNLQVDEIIYCQEDLLEEITKISRNLKFLWIIFKNEIVAKNGELIRQGIENLVQNPFTLNPSTSRVHGTHHLNPDLQIRDQFAPAIIRQINKSDQVFNQSVGKLIANSVDAESETQALKQFKSDGTKRMHPVMIDLNRINESIEVEQEYLYPTLSLATPSTLAKKDRTDEVNLDLSLSGWIPSEAETSEEESTIEGEESSYLDPTLPSLEPSTPEDQWTKTDDMNLDLTLALPNPAKDEEAGRKTYQ